MTETADVVIIGSGIVARAWLITGRTGAEGARDRREAHSGVKAQREGMVE